MASILSRISDAFVALDRAGRFTYANDRALALIGRSRAALIGQNIEALAPQPLGDAFTDAYRDALAGQRTAKATVKASGQPRWYEAHIYPSPTGVSIFFEDVSDHRLREEQLATDRDYLRQELGTVDAFTEIVGLSPGLRTMMARVSMVAATNTNVLITGETGTGKELVARALHDASPRRDRLLVKVNCAAISAGLVESELFGHERGAFTGALQRRKGRFELAHGGTLFLDEVGELPLETQVKLLRVLQEREFERVGGTETIRVDVRMVAATNRNLPEMVRAGTFREDLFYRLNVFPVTLPPLRDRADDIPLLAHTFLRRLARRAGRPITTIAPQAMAALCAYHWPGNVRELENVIERGVVLASGYVLDMDALPDLPHLPGHATPAPGRRGRGRAAGPAPGDTRAARGADGRSRSRNSSAATSSRRSPRQGGSSRESAARPAGWGCIPTRSARGSNVGESTAPPTIRPTTWPAPERSHVRPRRATCKARRAMPFRIDRGRRRAPDQAAHPRAPGRA